MIIGSGLYSTSSLGNHRVKFNEKRSNLEVISIIIIMITIIIKIIIMMNKTIKYVILHRTMAVRFGCKLPPAFTP